MPSSPSRSTFALLFILTSAGVLAVAGGLGRLLMAAMPPSAFATVRFPPAFAASTCALIAGSVCLSRAVGFVRRERQAPFRRSLTLALVAGSLFVAMQMAALNWLIRRQDHADVQTSERAFVAVLAALHALHFVLALLFLVFVTLKAHADRYDHEYYWGVSVCAWFWHALGVVWMAVLLVVAIGSI